MRFTVVTIFPEAFDSWLETSLLGKAREAGLVEVDFVDPRDFTADRHRSVDDAPYGGGPGMVMKAEPLLAAIESASGEATRRVLLSPAGAPLTQARVRALAGEAHVLLVCGRYEGIDERVEELAIDETLSVGDFVLSGGEIPAMAVIDAVCRFVPGVLGEPDSTEEESFAAGLLEYPQYTRPPSVRGLAVPEVLRSGDHARIARWRREQAIARTAARRPDLLVAQEGPDDPVAEIASRTWTLLAHHPVYDKDREVVTTAITNLDLHDVARSARTYGLAGYHVVTPVEAQREKVERILGAWTMAPEDEEAGHRGRALAAVAASSSIAEALERIEADRGRRPLVVATTADPSRAGATPRVSSDELRRRLVLDPGRPAALLLGTGYGLSDEVISQSDCILEPIQGRAGWNHLAVRSAAAVLLDRLFGHRG